MHFWKLFSFDGTEKNGGCVMFYLDLVSQKCRSSWKTALGLEDMQESLVLTSGGDQNLLIRC